MQWHPSVGQLLRVRPHLPSYSGHMGEQGMLWPGLSRPHPQPGSPSSDVAAAVAIRARGPPSSHRAPQAQKCHSSTGSQSSWANRTSGEEMASPPGPWGLFHLAGQPSLLSRCLRGRARGRKMWARPGLPRPLARPWFPAPFPLTGHPGARLHVGNHIAMSLHRRSQHG